MSCLGRVMTVLTPQSGTPDERQAPNSVDAYSHPAGDRTRPGRFPVLVSEGGGCRGPPRRMTASERPRTGPAMQGNATQYTTGATAWNQWQMSLMSAKRLQT